MQAAQSMGGGTSAAAEVVHLQQQIAEQVTVATMQTMEPMLRDRMIKRMVRAGQLRPASRGRVAEYAASLGLLEQAATPSGGGTGRDGPSSRKPDLWLFISTSLRAIWPRIAPHADLALDTPLQYVEDLATDLVDGDGGHGSFSSKARRECAGDADVGGQGRH